MYHGLKVYLENKFSQLFIIQLELIMPIIELPPELASKIAAGEVVERPASVVKELVENAIDASATSIHIRIEGGGKKLITVEDNGVGIPVDESRIALKRYATSKIACIDDLNKILTLGFRGEALASIAAVSRLTLQTRSEIDTTGIELIVEGGFERSFTKVGIPIGTRVRVENLFMNVPVRLKFLKKDITERRLISELISRYALIYSNIRFHLAMEGRELFLTSGNGEKREILQKIYDSNTAHQLLEVSYQDHGLDISGYISPLNITRANRKEIFFSLNGRLVSDNTLTSAVIRAYHSLIMVGRYPLAALFIKIDPSEIDVNVHPAKAEIKFHDPNKVFSILHSAVRKTIAAFSPTPEIPAHFWVNQNADFGKNRQYFAATDYPQKTEDFGNKQKAEENPLENYPRVPILRLIGQLGATYIAAEGPDGLYLIDQHAAHERILFEKLLQNSAKSEPSQLLLEPVVVHLSPVIYELLTTRLETLTLIGFQISSFGPNTFKINAVPTAISELNPADVIINSLEPDDEEREYLDMEMEDRIIAKICKKAAIKAGQILSTLEQEELIRQLENCESPRTCPHGRPTMIHLSVNMLERQFGRRGSI